MTLTKIIFNLFKKHIREDYLTDEIEKFKKEASEELVDFMKGPDFEEITSDDVKQFLTHEDKRRNIPKSSQQHTEQIKIQLLTETMGLLNNQIESDLAHLEYMKQKKAKQVHQLEALNHKRSQLQLISQKKKLIQERIKRHQQNLVELDKTEDKYGNVQAEIKGEFERLKQKIEKIQLNKALKEIREEFQNDGELAAIKASIDDLGERKRRGIIKYDDYRKGLLTAGIDLVNKIDDFYERILQRN